LLDFYGKILSQTQFFSSNFSKEIIEKLALVMKEKIYAHGDHIFEKNLKDGKLFFIRSGQIEYLLEFGQKTHQIKSK
jgi:CRP-like cAMP-binding protein